jgi:hypothetical protein
MLLGQFSFYNLQFLSLCLFIQETSKEHIKTIRFLREILDMKKRTRVKAEKVYR